MSIIFIFTVLLISSIIIIYRSEYINHDLYYNRFFYLVFLFIISILLIIISPNIVRILLGWDGLGLISYCLVSYYQNYRRYNSGILTVLINRVGDVIIIMRISIIFMFGRWNFLNFNGIRFLILLLILLACITKRAQFPFSSWLPAAIAAPTPVSSLVHSSTLVTAGIYLLIRFHFIIYKNNLLLLLIIIVGLITIIIAGISANFEFDLKKIIAFSTLSQLGLIIIIYSIKNIILTFFHLIIHAIFKSIIFICSGIIIHIIINYQDIRYIGNLIKFIPLTIIIFFISNLSLCGIPFFSGFYSKDQILEYIFIYKFSYLIYIYLIISTILTVIYSLRLTYYLINGNFNFLVNYKIIDLKLINFSIFILIFISLIYGNIINWFIFNNVEYIYLFFFEKIIILFICLISVLVSFNLYNLNFFNYFYFFKYYLGKIWFINNFNLILIYFPLKLGIKFILLFDKTIREYFFKNLINIILNNFNYINFINNNYLINIFFIIVNFILFILLLIIYF